MNPLLRPSVALTALLVGLPLASAPATAAPPLQVPRVEGIVLDGKIDDWADRGYAVDVLTHPGAARPARADLGAQARIGWTHEGLLIGVTVLDDAIVEADRPDRFWSRDSVSLFLSTATSGSEVLSIACTPNVGPSKLPAAHYVNDRRTGAARRPAEGVRVASQHAEGGYTIEVLVPWSALAAEALTTGSELSLQILVSDTDEVTGTPRDRLVWFPHEGGHSDAARLHRIVLSDQAGPPERVALSLGDDRLRRYVLKFASVDPWSGVLRISHGETTLGTGMIEKDGDLAVATVPFPLNPLEATLGPVQVSVDGKAIATVEAPDLRTQRIAALDAIAVMPDRFVFSGDNFPGVEFENAERAEILIGAYTLTPRYFDAAMNEVAKPTAPGRYGAVVEVKAAGMEAHHRYLTLFKSAREFNGRDWDPAVEFPLPVEMGIDPQVATAQADQVDAYAASRFASGFREAQWAAVLLAGLAETPPDAPSPATGPASTAGRETAWWHALRASIGQPLHYPHLVHLPEAAKEPGERKFPLLLFLHGSGERGRDLSRLENAGPRGYVKSHPDLPFILVSPQCPTGEWWNPLAVNDLVDELVARYPIDPNAIYLTGLSMGAFGTYTVLGYHPDRYAAAVAICGGGDPRTAERFAEIPLWVVHGAKDTVVTPRQSERMVEALRKASGRVRYTLDLDDNHDSWTATYNDPRTYDWLLQQRRGQPAEPSAEGPGTQPTETR